jgi:uncharacterized protein (TIGR02145 family)
MPDLIPQVTIESKIWAIRDKKVILDRDPAELAEIPAPVYFEEEKNHWPIKQFAVHGEWKTKNRQKAITHPRRFSMISFKTVTAICLGATLCTAETINIRGVVQDSGGVGIVGATVKLENANLSATSGTGGVFSLTGTATTAKPRSPLNAMAINPVQFRNGKIALTLAGNTSVGISIHNLGGRQVFDSKRTFGSGFHTINVPVKTTGIFLYKVTIGNEEYSLKASPFGASSTEQAVVSSGTSTLAKQAKATAVISDVIAATSPGMLNYRCVVVNMVTSGVVIKMIANAGDVTDADGNVYQSVRIGNQVWMTENLRVTKYNNGTAIPLDTSSSTWNVTPWYATSPKYCYYNNTTNADSIKKYGALYNWYVVGYSNPKKIAPTGWHVPSDAEWDTLQDFQSANGYNYDGTRTGNKIAKSMAAQTDWASYTTAGTIGNDHSKNNASGFSALPGGYRYYDGNFYSQNYNGLWWSAMEYVASSAYYRNLYYALERLDRDFHGKSWGCSVRLLRDNWLFYFPEKRVAIIWKVELWHNTANFIKFGTLKRGQHFKYLPYAFTELGVAMLSSVLNSQRAIEINIKIMRAFVRLREVITINGLSIVSGKTKRVKDRWKKSFSAGAEAKTAHSPCGSASSPANSV